MKILLFGIPNVGKSTIGKLLSEKLKYEYDDLDDEIKKRYKTITKFQAKNPYDYDRHRKRGKILEEIVDKYEDNVVIAVSPIYYKEFFIDLIKRPDILAIELQDKPESILSRLVYSDDDDNIFPLEINTEKEREYYLCDIKEDIKYYNKEYDIIKNKFNLQGEQPDKVTERLIEFIKRIARKKVI